MPTFPGGEIPTSIQSVALNYRLASPSDVCYVLFAMADDAPISPPSCRQDAGMDGEAAPHGGAPFPVVGVGASAGGLEALTQLLRALPHDTGMGFIIVQHLAPTHASTLAEILSRAAKMPVCEVRDEAVVEADHVYVIPPGLDYSRSFSLNAMISARA